MNVGQRGAVLIFDIDHFKLVNDSFGHSVGEETLRAAAGCCVNAYTRPRR